MSDVLWQESRTVPEYIQKLEAELTRLRAENEALKRETMEYGDSLNKWRLSFQVMECQRNDLRASHAELLAALEQAKIDVNSVWNELSSFQELLDEELESDDAAIVHEIELRYRIGGPVDVLIARARQLSPAPVEEGPNAD